MKTITKNSSNKGTKLLFLFIIDAQNCILVENRHYGIAAKGLCSKSERLILSENGSAPSVYFPKVLSFKLFNYYLFISLIYIF